MSGNEGGRGRAGCLADATGVWHMIFNLSHKSMAQTQTQTQTATKVPMPVSVSLSLFLFLFPFHLFVIVVFVVGHNLVAQRLRRGS